uniref:Uncharacterized protein n=1 Tax=Pseudovibrio sp. D323 TaxID=882118 RepID=M4VP18_9HYPH|nr:hypothetical protein [Pseudovibrio sp. D323]
MIATTPNTAIKPFNAKLSFLTITSDHSTRYLPNSDNILPCALSRIDEQKSGRLKPPLQIRALIETTCCLCYLQLMGENSRHQKC